ncbi:MAG: hypothetical protein M3460_13490 [Actinomycetota bacterium]|nr:hypothetical protein [Actinomycetota bacterium]
MSGTRDALLVGCSGYENPRFQQLPARQNIDALASVLTAPEIGGFRAAKLLNQPSRRVGEHIEGFFANRRPDDLLLLYFSCHGILDPAGQLYFATFADRRR